jgi:hypothetical protein
MIEPHRPRPARLGASVDSGSPLDGALARWAALTALVALTVLVAALMAGDGAYQRPPAGLPDAGLGGLDLAGVPHVGGRRRGAHCGLRSWRARILLPSRSSELWGCKCAACGWQERSQRRGRC